VPTEEQSSAYLTMRSSTANLKPDLSATTIFDFSPALDAAKDLSAKK
jgi:hypothetical protein